MRRKAINISIAILFLAVLLIGIPIGINECYKADTGYMTKWGASELLSYYGTVLGSIIAVVVFAATIIFSKKQIAYEQLVNKQEEHWKSIDTIITQALKNIDPLQIALITYSDIGYAHPAETACRIQAHVLNVKTSFDALLCYLTQDEYKRIEQLGKTFSDCLRKLESLSDQIVQQLNYKHAMDLRISCEKTIQNASSNPSPFEQAMLYGCEKFLKDHPVIPADVITGKIGEATKDIATLHNAEYQSLLREKRIAFEEIDSENIKNANKLLNWFSWKTDHVSTRNEQKR